MLRESIEMAGQPINLDGLTDPACTRIEGIANSEVLLEFANAFMSDDAGKLAQERDALAAETSPEAMVDAVGVASTFQRAARIADATGIPSDDFMIVMQDDLSKELGLDSYGSAANTGKLPTWKRLMLRLFVIPKFKSIVRSQSTGKC